MIDIYLLFIYILTVISIIATPGPVVLLVISTSSNNGFLAGVKTIFGTNIASLILMAIACSIILGLLQINNSVLNWIGLFGAIYLVYLSIKYSIDGYKMHGTEQPVVDKNVHGGFKQGFLTGISNPKDIVFFTALFPQFVSITNHKIASLSLLCLMWCLLDWVILLAFVFFFVKVFTHKNATKYVTIISGGILGIIGVVSIIEALQHIIN